MKAKLCLLSIFVAVALVGCQQLTGQPAKSKAPEKAAPPKDVVVVAKVGDYYITVDDLKREVENYNNFVTTNKDLLESKGKIDTHDQKVVYLKDDLVRKYILYKEALNRGIDKKENVVRALEDTKMSFLISELLRDEAKKVEVTSKEIEDFYNQNKDLLKEPEQRKISEIVTDNEDQAKQVYIEVLKGTDFVSLARQSSKAASAKEGGGLGYFSFGLDPKKRIRFDKFYEVAFAPTLDVGGFSNIFKGPDGFYIVKLEDVKKTEAKPLSELWDKIKSYLLYVKQEKALADLANKLSGETKIEIYEGKIE